jgi:hypothetical protein
MVSLEAARAASATAVGDPRNVEQLPGRLDIQAIKTHLQVQHLVDRFGLTVATARTVVQLAYGEQVP